MKKILIIARREFITTVTRKGYIFVVVGMPLFFFLIGGIGVLTGRSVERSAQSAGLIALIDRANLVDLSLTGSLPGETRSDSNALTSVQQDKGLTFVPYRKLDEALNDLKTGRVVACYVIEADYMKTGQITAYTREEGLFSGLSSPGRSQLYLLLRASLTKGRLTGETFERVLDPAQLQEMKLSKQGQIKPARSSLETLGGVVGPFGMFLLLTMAIFFSAGYLLQNIAEEKQNRVIEILLSSVKPTHLLTGKILGLGAAGLLQVAFYAVTFFVPAITFFAAFELTLGKIILSFVYFVLGYVLFAALMAGTGVIGNTAQESAQLSTIWTLTSAIPMFLIAPLSESPDSLLARGLSYFPLTAPVAMLLRLSVGSVSPVDIVVSIAMLLLGIYLAVKGSAKVFRAAALMYGKRPSLPEILRWLREA